MNLPHDLGTRLRILKMLVALLDRPHGLTKRQLAGQFDVSEDTIKRDVIAIRNAGFILEQDDRYRYHFRINQPYRQLRDLLHFGPEDQELLYAAIDQIDRNGNRAERLKKKLASLYDYRKLGHAYLRAPYLTKVDALKQAIADERVVVLRDYRSSNSDRVKDRSVEPFHLEPSEDLLHAYELDRNAIRHFKMTRFARVETTDRAWANAGNHHVHTSDVFRVVDNRTVPVYLRLKVGGYNALVEQFPLSKAYLTPSGDTADEYVFETRVNHRFIGLTNFVMGNYHQVIEVVEPQELVEHLRAAGKKFLENLGGGQ